MTTTESPAATIARAATHLRSLIKDDSRPWAADHSPEGTVVHPVGSTLSLFELHADGGRAAGTPCVSRRVGDLMAAMHPGVAAALADWLDAWSVDPRGPFAGYPDGVHALAVAQQVLLGAA